MNTILLHIDILTLFLALLPFPFILISNELLDKHTKFPREIHRKYAHILSGIVILIASYYLNYYEMILFSIAVFGASLLAATIRFKSLFSVQRKSIGNILYGLVTVLLAFLWLPSHPDIFRYGILILVIPDALAALLGSQYGTYIKRFGKSYLGSTVFFISMLALSFVFTGNIFSALIITVIITILEFFSIYGTDNLTMPLLGTYLLSNAAFLAVLLG